MNAWLTWLEGTAEVRSAVTLTLANGSLGATGGVDGALAPHASLIRTALFIFAAGLNTPTWFMYTRKHARNANPPVVVSFSPRRRELALVFGAMTEGFCDCVHVCTFAVPQVPTAEVFEEGLYLKHKAEPQ